MLGVIHCAVFFRLLVPSECFLSLMAQEQQKATVLFTNSIGHAERDTISPSVLCIGDALFDCIANDDARGLSVKDMVELGSWTAFPGGAPANVATACCKLGTKSAFAGCLGSDEDGDQLEDLLRDTGVDVTLVQRATDNTPTRRVMVTRSLEGDREFGGFHGGLSANSFADCRLDFESFRKERGEKWKEAERVINGVSWIVCSTLSLAFEKSADSISKLVDRGIENGAQLYVDINWRPVFWPEDDDEGDDNARQAILAFARRATIVKLTDEEAEWLFGISAAEALSDPTRIQLEFPEAVGVLVTAGEKGASYSLLGCSGRLEAFQVDVQETTGAGDSFTAGILHGLLSFGDDNTIHSFKSKVSPEELEQAVHQIVCFASATGALTCTKEGAIAAQPTFLDVESFLIHGESFS